MKPKSTLRHFLALAGSSLLAVSYSHAVTRNWDGDTSADWADAANWDTLPTNDLLTDIANFNLATYDGTTVFAPTVGTATSINGITIGALNGAMTLTNTAALSIGAGGIAITNGAGAFTISGSTTLGAAQSWTNNSGNLFTFDAVTNGANTLTIGGSGNTTASGVISNGAGGLTKNGTGILNLTAANLYTGTTTVSGGTLTLSGSGTLGATTAALTMSGGSLDLGTLSRTVGAVSVTAAAASGDTILNGSLTGTSYAASNTTGNAIISANLLVNGSAGFAKTGIGITTLSGNNTFTGNVSVVTNNAAGVLVLSGINSYTGTTTIGNTTNGRGTLSVNSVSDYGVASAIGAATSGAITLTGNQNAISTFIYTGTGGSMNREFRIGLSSDGTGKTGLVGAINNDGSGALILTASTFNVLGSPYARTFSLGGTYSGSANEIQGVIQDTTSATTALTKADVAIWKLSGSNTYTGATTLNAGTLSVSKMANYGVNSAIGQGTAGAAIAFAGGSLVYTGTGDDTNRLIQVSGGTGTILNNGTGALNFTETGNFNVQGTTATARTFTLGGTNGGTISGAIRNNNTGVVSFAKIGTGTWTLNGTNTFTGSTSVSGGGSLVLDYTTNNNSKLSNTASTGTLTLGGGTITIKGGSHTETVLSTTLTATTGSSITRDGGTSQISLGAFTAPTGSNLYTLAIAPPGTGPALATTANTNATGLTNATSILALGRVTVGSHFGSNSSGNIVAFSDYATATTAGGGGLFTINQLTGGGTMGAHLSSYALRIVNDGDSNVLNLDSFDLKLSNNSALLYAGGGNNQYIINGTGFLTSNSTDQPFVINIFTGATLTVNARIVGRNGSATGIVKAGEGTLVVGGANDTNITNGVSYIQQGVLRLANNTGLGATTAGTIVQAGAALELSQTTAETPANIAVGTEGLTINGFGISNGGALRNHSGDNSWAGAITIGAGGSRINSNASTSLTLTGGIVTAVTQDVTFGGAGNTTVSTTAISGAGGVNKDGAGTVTLSGANTYTGTTTVKQGTLSVTGSLSSNSALAVGGGTFSFGGSAAQTVNGLSVNAGSSVVTNTNSGTTNKLNLGAITRNAGGGSVNFFNASAANNVITTSNANTNGILGAWASVGGDWATKDGSGNIVACTAYTDVNRLGGAIADGAATNVRIVDAGSSGNVTLSGTTVINTLLQSASGGLVSVDVGTGNTLRTSGIMVASGAGALTVSSGTITAATAGGELIVTNNSTNGLTISSDIANHTSASSFTKLGTGSVTITSAVTYTGATHVNAGTLLANNTTGSGTGAGTVNVAVGGTLGGSGTIAGATIVNGNLTPGNSPGVLSFDSSLALAANSTTTLEIDGTTRDAQYDGVDVGSTLGLDGDLLLDIGMVFSSNATFDLFAVTGATSGDFDTVSLQGAMGTGSFSFAASDIWSLVDGNNTWTFTESTGDLSLAVIPEPGAALLGGLGVLLLLRRRR